MIFAYVTTLLLIWISTMTIVVWPCRVQYSLTGYQGGAPTGRKRKKVVFSPSPLSLDYKNIGHLFLGAEPPHLPTCIPHKHPILIILFLVYHFVSCWIPSVLSHKEPEAQSARQQVNDSNLGKNCGSKSQTGLSWVWVRGVLVSEQFLYLSTFFQAVRRKSRFLTESLGPWLLQLKIMHMRKKYLRVGLFALSERINVEHLADSWAHSKCSRNNSCNFNNAEDGDGIGHGWVEVWNDGSN